MKGIDLIILFSELNYVLNAYLGHMNMSLTQRDWFVHDSSIVMVTQ